MFYLHFFIDLCLLLPQLLNLFQLLLFEHIFFLLLYFQLFESLFVNVLHCNSLIRPEVHDWNITNSSNLSS